MYATPLHVSQERTPPQRGTTSTELCGSLSRNQVFRFTEARVKKARHCLQWQPPRWTARRFDVREDNMHLPKVVQRLRKERSTRCNVRAASPQCLERVPDQCAPCPAEVIPRGQQLTSDVEIPAIGRRSYEKKARENMLPLSRHPNSQLLKLP